MLQGWQCFVELRTLQSFPIARARFDELQEVLPGHNLQDLLSADMLPESVAEQQVMLFVFSMVLVDLLQRVGLEIAAVLGHSAGELPSVHVAGGLTVKEAAQLMLPGNNTFAQVSLRFGQALCNHSLVSTFNDPHS